MKKFSTLTKFLEKKLMPYIKFKIIRILGIDQSFWKCGWISKSRNFDDQVC